LLIAGKCPPDVLPLFCDTETWAIPKPGTTRRDGIGPDFRNLGCPSIHRKVASAVALMDTQVQDFIRTSLTDQHSHDKKGAEKIIQIFKVAHELHPDKCIFTPDGDNAFNRLNRVRSLVEVMNRLPALFPLLYSLYIENSNGWLYGLDDGIKAIIVQEGVVQGCTLATLLYAIGTYPFLLGLKEVLGDTNFVKFFVDDQNIFADFDTMIRAIEFILREGPKYGYHMKFTKGSFMIGKCGSVEASRRKKILLDIGLHSSIIHIHPDDVDHEDRYQADREYGTKMLGSFIGSDAFIKSRLEQKLEELAQERDAVMRFPDPQVKNLMFRWCFCQKITHLQRTTAPSIISDFVERFDTMKKEIFISLLNGRYTLASLPDRVWTQAKLNITDGGLGYHATSDVSYSAYLASLTECLPTISSYFPDFQTTLANIHAHADGDADGLIPLAREYRDSLQYVSTCIGQQVTLDWICSLSIRPDNNDDTDKERGVQASISKHMRHARVRDFAEGYGDDNKGLAWFTSLCNSSAGRWLDASPRSKHFKMTPKEYVTCIFYRMRLPSPFIIRGSRCKCKGNPVIDEEGLHLTTLCGVGGFRHATHDNFNLALELLFRTCGWHTRIEEQRCFQENDPDSRRRPDLSLTNAPGHQEKLILDLQITSPVTSVALSKTEAKTSLRAARDAYRTKMTKYSTIASRNNLEFIPLIIESTGNMHGDMVKLIDEALEFKSDTDIARLARLKRFWYSVLSFSLQKLLATSLLVRASRINGNISHHLTKRAFSESVIERFSMQDVQYLHR